MLLKAKGITKMAYKKEEIEKLFRQQSSNDTFTIKSNKQYENVYLDSDDYEIEFYSDDVVLEDEVFASEDKELEITDEDMAEYINKKYKVEDEIDASMNLSEKEWNEFILFGDEVKNKKQTTEVNATPSSKNFVDDYPKNYNENYIEFDDLGIGDASIKNNDEEWLQIAGKLDIK